MTLSVVLQLQIDQWIVRGSLAHLRRFPLACHGIDEASRGELVELQAGTAVWQVALWGYTRGLV